MDCTSLLCEDPSLHESTLFSSPFRAGVLRLQVPRGVPRGAPHRRHHVRLRRPRRRPRPHRLQGHHLRPVGGGVWRRGGGLAGRTGERGKGGLYLRSGCADWLASGEKKSCRSRAKSFLCLCSKD